MVSESDSVLTISSMDMVWMLLSAHMLAEIFCRLLSGKTMVSQDFHCSGIAQEKRKGINILGWESEIEVYCRPSRGDENTHGSSVPTPGRLHMCCCFSHLNVRIWDNSRV